MSWAYIRNLVTRTIKEWMEDDSITYSAALAFYFLLVFDFLLFQISYKYFF